MSATGRDDVNRDTGIRAASFHACPEGREAAALEPQRSRLSHELVGRIARIAGLRKRARIREHQRAFWQPDKRQVDRNAVRNAGDYS